MSQPTPELIAKESGKCKYHPDIVATRIVGHGHGRVCEVCWRLLAIGKDPAASAQTEKKLEAPKTEEAAPMKEKNGNCGCGKPSTHYGRCWFRRGMPGPPEKRVATRRGRRPSLSEESHRKNGTLIEELRAELERISRDYDAVEQAIKVLERRAS